MYNDLNKLTTEADHTTSSDPPNNQLNSMERSSGDLMVKLGPVVGDSHDEGFVVKDPPHSTGGCQTPDSQWLQTEIGGNSVIILFRKLNLVLLSLHYNMLIYKLIDYASVK